MITGGDLADTLIGLAGADTLNGGLGADIMRGGADNDIYFVDDAGDVVDEATTGLDRRPTWWKPRSATCWAPGVENLDLKTMPPTARQRTQQRHQRQRCTPTSCSAWPSRYAERRRRQRSARWRDGNDTLNGGDDNDTIIGGAGNDNIDVGGGVNTIIYNAGGFGNDVINSFDAPAAHLPTRIALISAGSGSPRQTLQHA